MAIGTPVNLGSSFNNASATTIVLTTIAAAAGKIVVETSAGTNVVVTVTDSGGNTYAEDKAANNGGSNTRLFSANGSLGSGGTITATFASSVAGRYIGACSVTGLATASAVDVSSTRNFFGSAGGAWASTGVTTTNANDILIGFSGSSAGTNASSTPDAGWTEIHDLGGSTRNHTSVYKIVSATGAQTASGVWSSTQAGADASALLVAYKEAAGTVFNQALTATQAQTVGVPRQVGKTLVP